MDTQERLKKLGEKAKGLTAQQIIKLAYAEFGDRVNFASSLGEEDQVITDMIAKEAPFIDIFTLDTGRLFPETYELWAKNQKKYPKVVFKVFYPTKPRLEINPFARDSHFPAGEFELCVPVLHVGAHKKAYPARL